MKLIAKIKRWVPIQRSVGTISVDSTIVADTPIDRAEQDLLARTAMAGRIAQILAGSGKTDGRVFAIRGAWGYGKSSLKNLVIEVLAARYPDVPVLDFNPWQWGDNDSIARALFQQMAGKLGGSHAPAATKRAYRLRQYGGLIDGKPYRTLRRHLSTHGLTPEEYRARYNLKADYPMVAPNYSEQRRAMAHKIGLGAKGRAARNAPAETPAPKPARKPRAKAAPTT